MTCQTNVPDSGVKLSELEPTTEELWDRFVHRVATIGLVLITVIVIGGVWMWIWN